ncbi:hypothetical protein PENTCL1PPCAC_2889, partial [Pristionchus entomophagus]
DVIFVVEGKKLHSSTQILAHASSYFLKLFYGSRVFEEKEIVLSDVSSEEFTAALEMIYDPDRAVTESTVLS